MPTSCVCTDCQDEKIAARRKRNEKPPRHGRKAKRTQHGYRARGAFDIMCDRLGNRQARRMALAPDEGAPWRVTRPPLPWEEKKSAEGAK